MLRTLGHLILLVCLVAACNSSGRTAPDGYIPDVPDGGDNGGGDGGGGDGGGPGKDGGGVGPGLPCAPGTYRCGDANAVQICNSSGSAWLYSSTCAVSCAAGLCTGACTPGARRCNSNKVEQCNGGGSAWDPVESCTTFCDTGRCALATLDVTTNKSLDGDVLAAGDIIVRSGATLTSPSGNLTLRGKSILVENGASIAATPTGNSPDGTGGTYNYYRYGGGGGGYGGYGARDASGNSNPGAPFGSPSDIDVRPGASGGTANSGTVAGGHGGGVLRLIASGNITISGQVTANGEVGGSGSGGGSGGGGGGSGGGIFLGAAGNITISGSVSANPGDGGTGYYMGGKGGPGRIKVLAGGTRSVTGTLSATVTQGLLPPLLITSDTHPDPTLIYNDDFPTVSMTWARPFDSRQGYYQAINTSSSMPPTPAPPSVFVATEMSMFPRTAVVAGDNYFHIVPVDAMSNFGTVESTFHIRVNTTPPTISSTSHPNQMVWVMNKDVFYQWSFPTADVNLKGGYYVLDHYGDTIPTAAATFLPIAQKQILRSGLDAGIWVMHLVAVDQRGYLTKAAQHYRAQIGADPGSGVVLGQVVDAMAQKVDGAAIAINRGLYNQTTNSTGNYNFAAVPAGTWEIRATKAGKMPVTQMITVVAGNSTTVNLAFP